MIAVSEVSAPTTDAMTGAVAEALGPDTALVLRSSVTPSDAEALACEHDLGAAAVARVLWDGPEQTVGVLRAHLRRPDRWIERRVTFSSADSRAERGRTLGYALASLLLGDPKREEAAATPLVTGPARAAPAARPVPSTAVSSPVTTVSLPLASAWPSADDGLSLDLAALATRGVGGPANGLGAALHAEYGMGHRLFLRGGTSLRTGDVPELDGGDTVATVGGGLAFRPWAREAGRPVGLGLILEAVAIYHSLSHRAVDGDNLRQGRLIGGAAVGLEGEWAIGRSFDLCLGLGGEVAVGSTDVTVATHRIATIPALRITSQLGLRRHF